MISILLLSFVYISFVNSFSCLDENGSYVDTWIAIKQPKGTSYYYYDSFVKKFSLSPYSMNNTEKGSLSYTTKQLWNQNLSSYVLYNDESPYKITDSEASFGHTKGYFAFSQSGSGFLVVHSIPLFPIGPNKTSTYLGLGSNAYTYAQSVICISLTADTLNSIAYKFLLNRPQIYDYNLSSILRSKYTNISNLVQRKYLNTSICAYDIFQTLNGTNFHLFAKSSQWNDDLYDGCVSPILQSTLWVESWIRGGAIGPYCPINGYTTVDINGLYFNTTHTWSETQDHSKWAIAINTNYICIGDINRMVSQYKRGGGTVCLFNPYMVSILKNATMRTNSCNTTY